MNKIAHALKSMPLVGANAVDARAGGEELTCSTCAHFHRQKPPPGPVDMSQPLGAECRRELHVFVMVQQQRGQPPVPVPSVGYPPITSEWPACGHYRERAGKRIGANRMESDGIGSPTISFAAGDRVIEKRSGIRGVVKEYSKEGCNCLVAWDGAAAGWYDVDELDVEPKRFGVGDRVLFRTDASADQERATVIGLHGKLYELRMFDGTTKKATAEQVEKST
jgi:hypothetical protein